MKKRRLIVAGILALLLAVAALVADLKYEALRSAPLISHAQVASSRTSFRGRLIPERLPERIQARLAARAGIPPWLLKYALPHEISVWADPDLNAGSVAISLFINDRRFGPVLAEYLDSADSLGGIMWGHEPVQRKHRGSIEMLGLMPISSPNIKLVRDEWGVVSPLKPLTLDETHMLDLVLDIRDGRGFALVAQLVDNARIPNNPMPPSQLIYFFNDIAYLRASADLSDQNDATIHLCIECRPEATEGDVGSLHSLLRPLIEDDLTHWLEQTYGMHLTGELKMHGQQIVGDYRLARADQLLERLGL